MDLIKIGNFIAGDQQDCIQMGDRHLSTASGGASCDE